MSAEPAALPAGGERFLPPCMPYVLDVPTVGWKAAVEYVIDQYR
jgi:hypothetical protein